MDLKLKFIKKKLRAIIIFFKRNIKFEKIKIIF